MESSKEHLIAEYRMLEKYLDDAGVPREDEYKAEYSILGRVKQLQIMDAQGDSDE